MKNKKDTSICPAELKPILKAINELPQDLKKFEDDFNELSAQYDKEYLQIIQKHGNRVVVGYEPLEKDLLELQFISGKMLRRIITPKLADLLNMTVKKNSFENARLRLRNLIREKNTLLRIIYAFNHSQSLTIKGMTVYKSFEFETPVYTFSFNEDTTLELSNIEILDIITKDKIPIKRIRICRACPNIFWAKRSDSPTCTSRCLNTFNKRKSEIKKRMNTLTNILDSEFKKFEKQKAGLGFNHPLVSEQIKKLDKIQNKLEREKLKYGTF